MGPGGTSPPGRRSGAQSAGGGAFGAGRHQRALAGAEGALRTIGSEGLGFWYSNRKMDFLGHKGWPRAWFRVPGRNVAPGATFGGAIGRPGRLRRGAPPKGLGWRRRRVSDDWYRGAAILVFESQAGCVGSQRLAAGLVSTTPPERRP